MLSRSSVSASAGGTSKSFKSPSRGRKISKAILEFVKAKYQKGDKAGQLTGTIYLRAVPCYGQNEAFKTKLTRSRSACARAASARHAQHACLCAPARTLSILSGSSFLDPRAEG